MIENYKTYLYCVPWVQNLGQDRVKTNILIRTFVEGFPL
jgi:hypothetical protein